MISTLQLSWKHNYTWHPTHYMWHHSHCICPATPGALIDYNSLGSYPTWHTYDIIHTLHDITVTLYDITPQYLWHHSPLHSWHQLPYIGHHLQGLWHLVPYPCDITDTIFVNTYQLYLTSNRRCRDNTTPISEITTSICVSVWSHTLYRWYNTHCIYDMAPTLFMAHYALYMTSHPRFMTSQPSTHDIKAIISPLTPIISESTSTESLSLHPNYRSYNPHCMYDNTATICMTSCKLHMTSHPLFMILQHAMTSHPLYSCHHTQDTWYRIRCSWTILIVYWLYHTYYM